ncbi:MAG: heat shock protein HtpX [Moorella sp. (in: firmicutes)]|jgi:heat shock protein HtpX|uniref:zinc metalloprotease HtpX n=1 Tax=unclassified Neomoorella TaxID=2676739 RepID=UPI0010FFB5D5|nr:MULTISPECIES: zinc metalloprotease HtpX [unclassified Moorella (in: firmicutes)]MDK2816866.1 heat shock protein HtpX [Moorella sp. (in: firmicutes)]MDK2895024.1 heat shock protein HtpX [Moorella sp. (in: firmicutes)]GEA14873.1 protease HtpX [Moorella sp. E308F]GEA17699.1 protease HtpX [Moorella sp. E306M]
MRRQLGSDAGLTARMFLTMFLLAALYLFFLAVLWQAGVSYTGIIIFVGIMLAVQYYFSDRMVLWSMGAREVSPREAPELHALVERLAALADLPKPRVAIVDTPMPNAFATGRSPANAVVAVTTGILERLDPPELEAVLGHELSHIKNRDMTVLTLASFFATVASFIVQNFFYWGAFGGRDRDERNNTMLVYLVSLVVWLVSYFLIRALSRYREFAADRGAAILTGAPGQLASALVKISSSMARIPDRDLRQAEAFNAFFIIPALNSNSIMELFSTHPSLERRLAYLRKLEREMEEWR